MEEAGLRGSLHAATLLQLARGSPSAPQLDSNSAAGPATAALVRCAVISPASPLASPCISIYPASPMHVHLPCNSHASPFVSALASTLASTLHLPCTSHASPRASAGSHLPCICPVSPSTLLMHPSDTSSPLRRTPMHQVRRPGLTLGVLGLLVGLLPMGIRTLRYDDLIDAGGLPLSEWVKVAQADACPLSSLRLPTHVPSRTSPTPAQPTHPLPRTCPASISQPHPAHPPHTSAVIQVRPAPPQPPAPADFARQLCSGTELELRFSSVLEAPVLVVPQRYPGLLGLATHDPSPYLHSGGQLSRSEPKGRLRRPCGPAEVAESAAFQRPG